MGATQRSSRAVVLCSSSFGVRPPPRPRRPCRMLWWSMPFLIAAFHGLLLAQSFVVAEAAAPLAWQSAGLKRSDDGGSAAMLLQYTDGEGHEQVYRIPESLATLPEQERIQEAMNCLLEETLDDIERLLNDVELLAAKGVDLESETFAMEDDDDLIAGASSGGVAEDGDEGDEEDDDDDVTDATKLSSSSSSSDMNGDGHANGATKASEAGAPSNADDDGPSGYDSAAYEASHRSRGLDFLLPPKPRHYTSPDLDRRERQLLRYVLSHAGAGTQQWSDDTDFCSWRGITCGPPMSSLDFTSESPTLSPGEEIPTVVLKIELPRAGFNGTLSPFVRGLRHLTVLNLAGNRLRGTLPDFHANLIDLRAIDLSYNLFTGSLPVEWANASLDAFPSLEELRLASNDFTGTIPDSWLTSSTCLFSLDLSGNRLQGLLPQSFSQWTDLEFVWLGDTLLSGSLPESTQNLTSLAVLDFGSSALSASLEQIISALPSTVEYLNLADNMLTGSFPEDLLRLSSLEVLILSHNYITGPLPTTYTAPASPTVQESEEDYHEGDEDESAEVVSFEVLSSLRLLWLSHNSISGPLPTELFDGLQLSLETLDISHNELTGTIPTEIGLLAQLYNIDAMGNLLRGTLPNEMLHLNRNLRLNFTDNLITGTIPGMFCGEGAPSLSMLYQEFGCDAVMCRPGTFSLYGHATLHSGCRPCTTDSSNEEEETNAANESDVGSGENLKPFRWSKVLGRTSCEGVEFLHGDLNGDGTVSPREILRMLYIDTLGRFWGLEFQRWADIRVHECELTGVACSNGEIVKIDLNSATVCSDGDRKSAPLAFCKGLPSEIGLITSLEMLLLTRQKFLRGSIPTELGQLTNLQLLDFASCSSLGGTIPSQLGNLSKLRSLKISHSQIAGSIPSELFRLPLLEVLHLTNNRLSGALPSTHFLNIKELMVARNMLTGTLPNSLSSLTKLENLEGYHNNFFGIIPEDIGNCTSLKRIDLFHNSLFGFLPESLIHIPGLQILHLKLNTLSGTIPELGLIPTLSWVDLSDNKYLVGQIPASLGTSRSLEDLRLGGNMLYDPIPHSLCTHHKLNGGATKAHGCEGVLCPIGTYAEAGHATEQTRCTPCPAGHTTFYLGGKKSSCQFLTPETILSMLFEVMNGLAWPTEMQKNWGDTDVPLCDWAGMTCDEDGTLTGISFPLSGLEEYFYG